MVHGGIFVASLQYMEEYNGMFIELVKAVYYNVFRIINQVSYSIFDEMKHNRNEVN